MNENEISEMIELAMQARTKAYEPYSDMQTGHCRICRTRLRDRCSKEQTGISDVFGRRAASGDISFE